MTLTFTPGQLRRRSDFYHQLAQFTSAGVGLVEALGELRKHPPDRSYVEPLGEVLKDLSGGCTLGEAVSRVPQWLPEFDQSLLRAGEQSGRLDGSFRLLSDYYSDRARVARQVISDLLYPLFLLHFAVFIFPFADFFTGGDWVKYLTHTIGFLAPLYIVTGLVVYATQSQHGERWRAGVETLLQPVPVLGAARRSLALGRLAAALEALLSAGVTVIQAWEMAGRASGSPALGKAVLAWRPLVDGGCTPAEALAASGVFPELFVTQYRTGEVSGKLDDMLRRLHGFYQEEGSRKLHAFAQWTPRAVYLLIVLMIAYRIVSFYAGYFRQIRDAGGF